MSRETKIREEVNEKIKKKINNSNYPEEVKEFLNRILLLEFEHIDEAKPRVTEKYKNYIERYAKKWEANST